MTPEQSRKLAKLIQDFSADDKMDFYYSTIVLDQDPLAYLSDDVQMLKVSFGGDRSEAGRYAANMRWKDQKKLEPSVGFTGKALDAEGKQYPENALSQKLEEMFTTDMNLIFYAQGTLEANQIPRPDITKKTAIQGIVDGMTDVSEKDVSEACLALFGTASNIPNGLAVNIDKQKLVQHFVDQWAVSANDSQRDSLLIQQVVQKVFKLDDALEPQEMESEDNWSAEEPDSEASELLKNPAVEKVLTSFVKAQYKNTQDYFKSKGIATVEIFRGAEMASVRDQLEDYRRIHNSNTVQSMEVRGNMKVWSPLRPLSSWTVSPDIANDFAGSFHQLGTGIRSGSAVVFRTQVEVSRIFATPFTGVGCLGEYEVVLLGGRIDAVAGDSAATTLNNINYSALYGERDEYS